MTIKLCNPVIAEPFPHIVIENALPDNLYADLDSTFPEDEILRRPHSENQRIDIHAREAECLPPIWRAFVMESTTTSFWHGVLSAFGRHIREYYPHLNDLRFYRTSVRGAGDGLMQLDCQPGVNTPQTTRSRVRGPHLDNPIELYAGMLYMGEGEGDLEIYRQVKPLVFHGKLEIEDDCVEVVSTVKYQPNTLVFFLNTPKSIHGVTYRNPTDKCRRMVNFIGEMRQPLFKVGHGRY